MNGIVTTIIIVAGVAAGINFAANYLGFYRKRRGKRRLRRSERRTIRTVAFGIGALICLDLFLSYAAASTSRILSIVILILNIAVTAGCIAGVTQATDRQAGILGTVAIPCILCIGITVAGTFPSSLPVALFAFGGALLLIGVFRVIQINFNWTARSSRLSPP